MVLTEAAVKRNEKRKRNAFQLKEEEVGRDAIPKMNREKKGMEDENTTNDDGRLLDTEGALGSCRGSCPL